MEPPSLRKKKMTNVTHNNIAYNDTRWDTLADLTKEVRNRYQERYDEPLDFEDVYDIDAILTGDQLDHAIVVLQWRITQLTEEN